MNRFSNEELQEIADTANTTPHDVEAIENLIQTDDSDKQRVTIKPNDQYQIPIKCCQGTEIHYNCNEINNKTITFILEYHASDGNVRNMLEETTSKQQGDFTAQVYNNYLHIII